MILSHTTAPRKGKLSSVKFAVTKLVAQLVHLLVLLLVETVSAATMIMIYGSSLLQLLLVRAARCFHALGAQLLPLPHPPATLLAWALCSRDQSRIESLRCYAGAPNSACGGAQLIITNSATQFS